jgi:LmbE family N-acetylglucosaminyl deacetylase
MGGTIRRLVDEGHTVHGLAVGRGRSEHWRSEHWLCSTEGLLEAKAVIQACESAAKVLGMTRHGWKEYGDFEPPDNQFDLMGVLPIAQFIERHLESLKPTIVYTHAANDLNVDHRLTHQAVLTACRPLPGATVTEVYAFEVLSSTEWGGGFHPNLYMPLTEAQLQAKLDALACYTTEMREFPHPRSPEAIRALAALRGSQCGHARAEAFEVIRVVR